MATNTYVALDKVTLGSAAASVTFSSIPQGYTDLVLVCNYGFSNALSFLYMQINGDTGSNYSMTELYGTGSSAGSYRESNQTIPWVSVNVGGTTSITTQTIINFMNYSNTATYKTWLARTNNTTSGSYPGTNADVGLWRSTSAINSITLKNRTGGVDYNFAAGSTFSLYGIAAASVGAKATGGVISSDDQYYYHTFASTGTFTPLQSLTCDYLIVAGGGGGGSDGNGAAAGGGAGGFRTATAASLTATGYTVTVGAGGAGGLRNYDSTCAGTTGSDSVFNSITSAGGGGGGAGRSGAAAKTGGSGGGGAGANATGAAGNTPSTSPVQGYAGGNDNNADNESTGGGGGAGAVGGNGTGQNNTSGAGGAGVASSMSGTSVTYAGGGGGAAYRLATSVGAGGNGGGGSGANAAAAGGSQIAPTSGTANTGGGGGGGASAGGNGFVGGSGGSGIVIVRYAK